MILDFDKWLSIFDYKNLDKFFKEEKGKGGIGEAIGRAIAGYIAYAIPTIALLVLGMVVIGATELGAYGSEEAEVMGALGLGIAGLGIVVLGILFVLEVIIEVVLFILSFGLIHVLCGMLGGKGEFSGYLHAMSYVVAAGWLVTFILAVPGNIALMVPEIGVTLSDGVDCLVAPFGIAGWLYFMYVTMIAIRNNYGLSDGRSVLAIAISLIVWIVIAIAAIVVSAMILGLTIAALFSSVGSGYGMI